MKLHLEIDLGEQLSERDKALLHAILGGKATPARLEEIAETKPAKAAPAKTATKAKAEPEPEPEPEAAEEGGATMEQAVEAATKLVAGGKAAKVKTALTDLGVKRVSELDPSDIQAFLDAVNG